MNVDRFIDGEIGGQTGLLSQGFVYRGPLRHALGKELLHARADLAFCIGRAQPLILGSRHDNRHVSTVFLDMNRPVLSLIEDLSEFVFGVGSGDGGHDGSGSRMANIAILGGRGRAGGRSKRQDLAQIKPQLPKSRVHRTRFA